MIFLRKPGELLIWALVILAVSACQGRSATAAPPAPAPSQAVTLTAVSLPSLAPASTGTLPPIPTAVQPPTAATTAVIPTPTPPAAASPTAQGQLSVTSAPKVTAVVENLPDPDDLLIAPDGSLYISVIGDGSVRKLTTDGKLETVAAHLSDPEGMIFLPDGSLVIAEQGKNRLVRLDPKTGANTPFIQLQNPSHQLGVDGIALDSHTPGAASIIIPDSPNGTLLRASLDGAQLETVARGLARPTAAWVEADGSILVVEEFGRSLLRIHPDGTRETLAGDLSEPDDVVEDGAGRIFVNTLADGAVHMLSSDGKQKQVLIDGLHSPQGIAVDADGNLYAADSGQGRVLKLILH